MRFLKWVTPICLFPHGSSKITMPNTLTFIKEYRTLLEKLLETKVRVSESCIGQDEKDKLIIKIDGLIDKLILYFHKSLDRSLKIFEESERYYER